MASRVVSRSAAAAFLVAVLAGLIARPAAAEEVRLVQNGIALGAWLERAPGKTLGEGVVLITHGQLAHNRMELVQVLQRLLAERGRTSLALTLSYGQSDRKGFFDCGRLQTHRPIDALAEIGAWVGWLEAAGAREIVLLGHSQGGAQTARFAAERDRKSVKAVVLLAPATFILTQAEAVYRSRFGIELGPILARARALVEAGKPTAQIDQIGFLTCENATATAQSVLAWYAEESGRDTPTLLPRLVKPTLVLVAENDVVVPDLKPRLPARDDRARLTVKVINAADHFFNDLFADDAVDEIVRWLER